MCFFSLLYSLHNDTFSETMHIQASASLSSKIVNSVLSLARARAYPSSCDEGEEKRREGGKRGGEKKRAKRAKREAISERSEQ